MNKLSQTVDCQKNPRQAAIAHDMEGRCDNAALSDDDLGLISAAGAAAVPTMNPEVLMGRHDISDKMEENKP